MKVALLTLQSRVSPVFETTCSWLVINANEEQCVICDTYYFNAQNEMEMANELLLKNIQKQHQRRLIDRNALIFPTCLSFIPTHF